LQRTAGPADELYTSYSTLNSDRINEARTQVTRASRDLKIMAHKCTMHLESISTAHLLLSQIYNDPSKTGAWNWRHRGRSS